MTRGPELPPGFESLEPFAAAWAVSGSANRARRRGECTAEERTAFYNAAKDLAAPALAYLDRKPLDRFSAAEQRLMDMMLSLAHITLAIEVHGVDEPKHTEDRAYMRILHSPADA
jgi:hypothetical protein